MPKNTGRNNTNQNTTQTLDSEPTSELPVMFTKPIFIKDTNIIEIDPIMKSLTNNLNKEKGIESFITENITQKTTINVDESFDVSENILDTSVLDFDIPLTHIVKLFVFIFLKKFSGLNFK
ncbi:14818_t:CDS:1 [Funneliformis caledonium]|uniref:14818_t:CDS:1 n=1 Tax=Funneliformis caledonium TaxID=1117310 RepID=A0A9N9HGB1_9GLOM|nr:14818_t:CDS:1 [Funneliformis caledonium]